MIGNRISLAATMWAVTSAAIAAPKCETKVGEKVEILSGRQVTDLLSVGASPKGEFETTKAYKERTQKAKSAASTKSLIVATARDDEFISYDADNERFEVTRSAWSNTAAWFDQVFKSGNEYGMSPVSISATPYGLGLGFEELSKSLYNACNAMGACVDVVKINRVRYSLFDKPAPADRKMWKSDFPSKGSYLKGNFRAEGVYVPAKIAIAPNLKTSMRFGIEFKPRKPYIAEGTDYYKPTISNQQEVIETIRAFVGDIHCAIVTDGTGTVLKTVPVVY